MGATTNVCTTNQPCRPLIDGTLELAAAAYLPTTRNRPSTFKNALQKCQPICSHADRDSFKTKPAPFVRTAMQRRSTYPFNTQWTCRTVVSVFSLSWKMWMVVVMYWRRLKFESRVEWQTRRCVPISIDCVEKCVTEYVWSFMEWSLWSGNWRFKRKF